MFEKILSRHQTLVSQVFRSIFGTWRTNFKTYFRFWATCCKIWLHIVKNDKMRTWGLWVFFRSKNRFSLKWPILSGKSIYGRKMTFWVSQSGLEALFDIQNHLGQILRKSKKIAFFGFLTCGSPPCPGRNFGRSAGNRPNNVADPSGHIETFFRKKSLQ